MSSRLVVVVSSTVVLRLSSSSGLSTSGGQARYRSWCRYSLYLSTTGQSESHSSLTVVGDLTVLLMLVMPQPSVVLLRA